MTDPVPVSIATTETSPEAADTIVFTHGWVDDRTAWDGVLGELGDAAHCISWDLRGHGESEVPPPGNYTREHALADMETIVGGADGPVVLAGHSLGGYLALAYTLLHPEQVRGLVLVAAGPGFRNPEAREQWNDNVDASAAKLGVPEGSEVISKHVDSWVLDSLSEIDVPTIVLVGEYDKRFQASAAVFEKNLDVRANELIADAGHGVHKKKPAEIAAAIRGFLGELV